MTLDELEAEAMKLDPPSRSELARRLAASLAVTPESSPSPPPSEEEKERLWLQDAMRRSRELKERQLQTEPSESSLPPGVPFRPPLPAGRSRPSRPAVSKGRQAKRRPRPSRKKATARRPKPRGKPARAKPRRAKPRPKPAKTRAKSRPRPRRPRR